MKRVRTFHCTLRGTPSPPFLPSLRLTAGAVRCYPLWSFPRRASLRAMSSSASREVTGVPSEEEAESYRKSRIYTRTGDTGMTSLYNMQRRCKAEDFFMALGSVDEVNSLLGVVREHALLEQNGLEEHIAQVPHPLPPRTVTPAPCFPSHPPLACVLPPLSCRAGCWMSAPTSPLR